MKHARLMLLALLVIGWTGFGLRGQTVTVATPASSIQAAIQAAPNGTTIMIGAGTWHEPIDLLGKQLHIKGQGPGATVIDAGGLLPAVTMTNGEPFGTIIEGLTLQNGRGIPVPIPFLAGFVFGGAIHVFGSTLGGGFPEIDIEVKNCELRASFATAGAGLYAGGNCRIKITDSVISTNIDIDPLGTTTPVVGTIGVTVDLNSTLEMRGCLVENNVGGGVNLGSTVLPFPSIFEDTVVRGHSSFGIALGGTSTAHRISRCLINSNSPGLIIGGGLPSAPLRVEDSIIVNNAAPSVVGAGGAMFINGGTIDVYGCTFEGNTAPTGSLVAGNFGEVNDISFNNCIMRGHGPNAVDIPSTIITQVDFNHCNFEGGIAGPGNIDMDPLFVDPANGDYRLRCNSPCINAGSALFNSPNFATRRDIEGDIRPLFGVPDMGADESDFVGYSTPMAGGITDAAGSPAELLRVNGSTGAAGRCVELSLGQSFDFSMDTPPGAAPGRPFAVFGAVGVPELDAATVLPSGIGTMAFAPCALVPFWSDVFFTLTNNITPLPCGQAIASFPTPWSSASFPGFGFPVDFTVQGVVEQADGSLGVTNGVVVSIR
jgi:Right handed beta helix region